MDFLSISSGVAGLLSLAIQVSGTIAEYAIAVKEGPKHIRDLQHELLLLRETLGRLKDFFVGEQFKGRDLDNTFVLDAAITACKNRIEQIRNKLKGSSDGSRMSRMVDRLKWPYEHKEVLQTVDSLRRFTQTFQFALTIEGCNLLSKNSEDAATGLQVMLDTANKVNELSLLMGGMSVAAEESAKKAAQIKQVLQLVSLLSETAAEVKEISHSMRLAELREQEQRTTEILDWLAPVSVLQKHFDVQAKRTPGTGEWFLEKPEVVNWLNTAWEGHDLLCMGGPGVGKTVLTSLVVDYLREAHGQDSDIGIAYYYCDYGEQQAQTPMNFVSALLRQLSRQSNAIPTALSEFYQRSRNDLKDQTWYNELQKILQRVASTFAQCFIVIDALDETDTKEQRSGLLDALKGLRLGSTPTPKIFVTTRPHALTVQQGFDSATKIEVSASEEDLRAFLLKMIDDYPDSDYIMDEPLKAEILDKLCQNAQGMFLLPALQIKDILDQFTKADVRRALRTLSVDLKEVFSSTIERIKNLSGNRRTVAWKCLLWISHAKRALAVDELRHALATRLEDEEFDDDNMLSVKTILASCFGLVEVDKESSTIRFVHYSLEEFLRAEQHGLFEDAEVEVTRICLRYLTLNSLKELHFKNRSDFNAALADRPFLNYAAAEWGYHAANVPVDTIKDLVLLFLGSPRYLLAAVRVRDHKSPNYRKWKEKMWAWAFSDGAGISMATTFGLTEIVQLLLSQTNRPVLTARNMYGSTPLHEAAIRGYDSTAELLISHKADVFDVNWGKSTPLFLAVAYGHLSTVRLLLRYGREQLIIPGKEGFSPLHKAVDTGGEEMVTFLLQVGAGVGATNDKGMTPLHLAARRGDVGVAKLLMLAGAVVHSKAAGRMTPLDYAATGGHFDTVELLLNNGGRLDQWGDDKWLPIHRAARGGHLSTTRLLIERGSNLLGENHRGSLPIHLAVKSGNGDVVSLLLQSNPNIRREQLSAKDKNGSTPRDVAFYTANFSIHKMLRSAEMNVLGGMPTLVDRMTLAIEEGDSAKVLQMLNENPAEIEKPNDDGQPPLHVAMREKRLDIARLLLDQGASIQSVGYHSWQPLHIASSLGSLELVNLCLAHGASVHALTDTQQTALHKTCSSSSSLGTSSNDHSKSTTVTTTSAIPIIHRLLLAGANPEAQNHLNLRPLHVAAHRNFGDVVHMLVTEIGVDVLAVDRFGDTATSWAERAGHLDLVAFLRAEEKKIRKKEGRRGKGERGRREGEAVEGGR